jgi:hypothetical protein
LPGLAEKTGFYLSLSIKHPHIIEGRIIEYPQVFECLVESGIVLNTFDEPRHIGSTPDHDWRKRYLTALITDGGVFQLGKKTQWQETCQKQYQDYAFAHQSKNTT